MTVGECMKAARIKAGFTVTQAEFKSGMSGSVIRDWERGKRVPLVSSAEVMADTYGISIDELIGHEVKRNG